MTPAELVHLASAAFPGRTFNLIDVGNGPVATSSAVSVRRLVQEFAVTIRGTRGDYTGLGDTIEAAHADALACRAEYDPPVEPVPATQGTLDL